MKGLRVLSPAGGDLGFDAQQLKLSRGYDAEKEGTDLCIRLTHSGWLSFRTKNNTVKK